MPELNLNWIDDSLESIRTLGYSVTENVLTPEFLELTREAMYRTQNAIQQDVGSERLARAGEVGVLRLMMKYDSHFFQLIEIPEVLTIVDALLSDTAIMHLQNGFILPSSPKDQTAANFQHRFHQDFPRVLNGYCASINVMFAIDEFTTETGATQVVPRSHQSVTPPDQNDLDENAIPIQCQAGSLFVFDSTLWHAAGVNTSGKDRLAINHQFTRSYIKQQIDYVRALGDAAVLKQQPRTQQLLGWYTRVVTSLDEFYQPEDQRLYQRGQG